MRTMVQYAKDVKPGKLLAPSREEVTKVEVGDKHVWITTPAQTYTHTKYELIAVYKKE